MPDGSATLGPTASPPGGPAHDAVAASARDERPRGWLGMRRNVSPLLRRILLLNALPPFLLATSLLYLDQYQNGLLAGEVLALRTQARIYANGVAEAAVRIQDDHPVLVPDIARPLLRRLTEPSPATQAKLFDNNGLLVADSRVRESANGNIVTEPLPPPNPPGAVGGFADGLRQI